MTTGNVLVSVRIPPWQAFKLRRYAEESGRNEGAIVAEALQGYFNLHVDDAKRQDWLKVYAASEVEAANAVE